MNNFYLQDKAFYYIGILLGVAYCGLILWLFYSERFEKIPYLMVSLVIVAFVIRLFRIKLNRDKEMLDLLAFKNEDEIS